MAKFSSPIWVGSEGNSNAQLEIAVALWLRTLGTSLDNELGLVNFIRLTVTPSKQLFFAEGIPNLTGTVISNGQCLDKILGINILWTSQAHALHRHLTLEYIQYVSNEVVINVRWLEYALAKAIESLYNHGIDWTTKFKKVETIGGIEKVDWL